MEELEALVILNQVPLLGSMKIKLLIDRFGSASKALSASLEELAAIPGFGPQVLQSWKTALQEKEWEKDLALAERLQAEIIPYTSPSYPKRLLQTPDFPIVLYAQGTFLKEDQRCLTVIGTRQAGIYGLEMARAISRDLSRAGYTIVSGLARGIDTAAHEGALEGGGRTLAVLGSGLANLYPQENRALAARIRQNGALLSEFPMSASPNRHHFPQRNRIVSGMTLGTILIEAPLKSGAMLTVERAMGQGRPVFVLPGRADQENFKGNHALIKERKGELVENAQDILKYFNDYTLPLVFFPASQHSIQLGQEEGELLEKMPIQEASVEELINLVQWPAGKLNSLLMSLVLKKKIKEYPGKIYKKV